MIRKSGPPPTPRGFVRHPRPRPLPRDAADSLAVLLREAKEVAKDAEALYGERTRLYPSPFFCFLGFDVFGYQGAVVRLGLWPFGRKVAHLSSAGDDLELTLYEHRHGLAPQTAAELVERGRPQAVPRGRVSELAERLS